MIMSNSNVCACVPINAETPSEFVTLCTTAVTTQSHEAFQLPAHVDIAGFFC